MAGIGSLFQGLAQGIQSGAQIAQRNAALRQNQQTIDLSYEKQQLEITQLQNSMRDAQVTAQALSGVGKAEQADAQMFDMLKSARELAGADASIRKTQFPVFAANYKKATGQDLAPNVQEAFLKGDTATLTALIDNATNSVLKGNGKAEDVLGLLSDPTRSSAWLASNAARVNAASGTPETTSPQDNTLQTNILILKRQAGYAQQKADQLTEAAGQQTTVEGLKNVTALIQKYQEQADKLNTKAAELGKPVSLAQGGALVDPTSGATVAERDPRTKLLTPEEMAQAVQLAGAKAEASAAGRLRGNPVLQAGLEGGALDRAAATYNIDGTLPSLGRGAQGIAARLKIMERAAEMSAESGDTGQSAAIRAQFNKTLVSGARQLQAQKQKISAFERTALKNADLVLSLSDKADRTGTPAFNRWLLAGKKAITGDASVTAYDVALRGFINEYARIVTTATGGGVTTDTARKEIEDTINRAQTPEQLKAAINTAKTEMKNRITSFDEEFASIRAQFTGPQPGDANFTSEDRSQTGAAPTTTKSGASVSNW